MRQQVGAFDVGAEFPGLPADASLLDGAAGSQCHHTVVEAVSRQLAFGANVGGQHPHSMASTDVLREARGALGDLLQCESDEVVFGPSATALVVHVARALGETWSEGDNVVLSIVAASVPFIRRRRHTKENSHRPTTTATSSPGSSPRSGRAVTYDT